MQFITRLKCEQDFNWITSKPANVAVHLKAAQSVPTLIRLLLENRNVDIYIKIQYAKQIKGISIFVLAQNTQIGRYLMIIWRYYIIMFILVDIIMPEIFKETCRKFLKKLGNINIVSRYISEKNPEFWKWEKNVSEC